MPFTVKKLTPIKTDSLPDLGQSTIDLAKYVEDEFGEVAKSFQATEPDHIWNVQPPRPRRGTTAYADGTNWNPGHGEGPYFWNGSAWFPEFQYAFDVPAVTVVRVQAFTTVGTSTYIPNANMLFCMIECIGGGGGAGGTVGATGYLLSSGGGGGGGYARAYASKATIGASQTVTVGAGGVGGSGGNPGANGGTSSVGPCSANGGLGSTFCSTAQASAGGQGGGAPAGQIVGSGGTGGFGCYIAATGLSIVGFGGIGGNAQVTGGGGQGGGCVLGGSAAGGAAIYYGGGGGGCSTGAAGLNQTGGNGYQGVVYITEFCSA